MINKISKPTNLIFNIMFLFLSLVAILPFVLVFMISISDEEVIRQYSYQLIPKKFSLEAYRFLWNHVAVARRIAYKYINWYGLKCCTDNIDRICTVAATV